MTKYQEIIKENLARLYFELPPDFEKILPGIREGKNFLFEAFGQKCTLSPDGIWLSGHPEYGPLGVLISLYALNVSEEPLVLEPLKAFKDFPNSMPYQGAFTTNAERILLPHINKIVRSEKIIKNRFRGHETPAEVRGDFSFILYPLPKIALAYIFYFPDEEFPPSATCLFSFNALSFMPLDGLADVAEYTSKAILNMAKKT